MRVRIVLRSRSPEVPSSPAFASLGGAARPWRGLVGSMCLHATLAGGLTLAQDIWRPDPLDSYLTSSEFARLVPLRLHADTLPVSPAVKGPERRIELAKTPANDDRVATVLQPDLQKITATDLPPLFFWAEQQAAPKDQLLSPSWKRAEAAIAPAAEPRLGVPNQQDPGEHTIKAGSAADAAALVVLAGSGGLPLRDLSSAEEPRIPFGWSEMGDAVNALVLSPAEALRDRVVLLPPGSNSGRAGSDSGAGVPPGVRSHSANDSGPAERPASAKPSLAAVRESFHLAEYAIVEHPPDSMFDVIATHSSSEDALPNASVKLSGAPVYTAFVPVGSGNEWIFQYCLMPSSRRLEEESRFVSLQSAESIQAPFPLLTVLPRALAPPASSYALVHAILTAAGFLKNINVTGLAEESHAERLKRALSGWCFRPVLLNDQPVEAEILLGIPR